MLFEFLENTNSYTESNLFDENIGFEKGNMFKNLYKPYKNYEPSKIKPKNEKEAMLLNIMKLSFAINDLNLYLDLYPNDQEIYELFKHYSKMYQKYLEEYERKYQVLEVCHDTNGMFTWSNTNFPWEDNYV